MSRHAKLYLHDISAPQQQQQQQPQPQPDSHAVNFAEVSLTGNAHPLMMPCSIIGAQYHMEKPCLGLAVAWWTINARLCLASACNAQHVQSVLIECVCAGSNTQGGSVYHPGATANLLSSHSPAGGRQMVIQLRHAADSCSSSGFATPGAFMDWSGSFDEASGPDQQEVQVDRFATPGKCAGSSTGASTAFDFDQAAHMVASVLHELQHAADRADDASHGVHSDASPSFFTALEESANTSQWHLAHEKGHAAERDVGRLETCSDMNSNSSDSSDAHLNGILADAIRQVAGGHASLQTGSSNGNQLASNAGIKISADAQLRLIGSPALEAMITSTPACRSATVDHISNGTQANTAGRHAAEPAQELLPGESTQSTVPVEDHLLDGVFHEWAQAMQPPAHLHASTGSSPEHRMQPQEPWMQHAGPAGIAAGGHDIVLMMGLTGPQQERSQPNRPVPVAQSGEPVATSDTRRPSSPGGSPRQSIFEAARSPRRREHSLASSSSSAAVVQQADRDAGPEVSAEQQQEGQQQQQQIRSAEQQQQQRRLASSLADEPVARSSAAETAAMALSDAPHGRLDDDGSPVSPDRPWVSPAHELETGG